MQEYPAFGTGQIEFVRFKRYEALASCEHYTIIM